MTLEEINRRLRKNPYYEGSQAQKEAQAGVAFQGNDVVVPEQSRQQVEQIRQEYNENRPTYSKEIVVNPTRDTAIQIGRVGKQTSRNFLSKMANGAMGLVDVPFQEVENNLQKGEKSNKRLLDYLVRSGIYAANPTLAVIKNSIDSSKNVIDTLKDPYKNNLEKVIDTTTSSVTNLIDGSTPNKYSVEEIIKGIGKVGKENGQTLSKNVQNIQDKIDAPAKEYSKEVQRENENFSQGEQTLFNVAGAIGNMVPSIATAAITKNPTLGLATMGYSVKGQATEEAREKGVELQKAIDIGNTKGAIEVGTELLTGGINFLGKGALDDIVKRGIDSKVKNQVLNFITKKGYDFSGEVLEETVSDMLNTMIDRGTTDPDISYSVENWKDTALTTLLTTAVLNGISGGYEKRAYNQNIQEINENMDNVPQSDINIKEEVSATGSNKNSVNQFGTETSSNDIISQIQNNTTQKQLAPLNKQAQIKYDSNNFAKQVENINNIKENDSIKVLSNTPKVYIDLGIKDLPMTITKNHTLWAMEKQSNNTHRHGIEKEIIKKIPEAIQNPLNIVESGSRNDSIVAITELSDSKGNLIIVPIKVSGRATVNEIQIDANVLTSIYGKDKNYDGWMKNNQEKGRILYDIDEGIIKKYRSSIPRLQLSNKTTSTINNIIPQNENYASNNKKSLNPVEISNLTQNDVSTTPKLSNVSYNTDNSNNSKFYNNLMSKADMLNDNVRNLIKNENDVKYYQGVTNEQSLNEAYNRLNEGGARETMRWFSKDLSAENVNISATEVAEGWILLKQYQDVGDYESATNVAKKMRNMATKAGQALQAYNIQARLTPEGMKLFAQSELDEAFSKFSKNKTQEWIDKHENDFKLKPEEERAIIDKVKEAQKFDNNSYEKKEKLAEIQKIIKNKLPPERGAEIKAWMRISMLFNPKTQVRNVLGNAVISPVNAVGDTISTMADKVIARKTGVRTTGLSNPIQNLKGFKKGLYNSYNDFRKGINTRDISGDRFEIGQGKSFKDKGLGKALNRVDSLLNFVLDAGDRPFYEATFTNSINNQLVLNNTDIVTQDMIDIATNEALSRTWQDDNGYTQLVLNIRNALNGKIKIKGKTTKGARYGLGDILIPFAKTPANLTKAIIDYSPAGLINTLVEGNDVRKAISRGDLTAQQQHRFVQDLGKATAGSMLYILGYALVKSGVISGENDEDKDVANFMKNNLGVSNYSIKIGNKTFTYDWAQPIAAPLAMMSNLVNKNDKETTLLEKITSTLNVPLNTLLEQSFMQSINTVLTNNDGPADGLFEAIAELPSRAVPTLMKQIADMVDSTQRATYEKGKPIETAVNKIKAKIPGLSKQLAPVSNTLGQDINKYGGETNPFLYAFHTFINPANVNSNQKNKAGIEIYKVYQKTGDKTIFPRQASYSQIIDGNKITLTSQEKYRYQKNTGEYYNKVVNQLLKSNTYKKLSDKDKAKILTEIASDSNEIAKEKLSKIRLLNYERQKTDVRIDELVKNGLEYSNAYIYKTQIKDIEGDKDKNDKAINGSGNSKKAKYIMDLDTNDIQKDKLLSLLSDSDTIPTVADLKKLNGEYLTYMQQSGSREKGASQRDKYMIYIDAGIPVNTLNQYYSEIGKIEGIKNADGKTISGSKKSALFNYINNLSLNATQKKILFTKCNASYGKSYKNEIFQYINSLTISKQRKEEIWKELYE